MTSALPLEFGDRLPDRNYRLRPGSYAVVLGEDDQVALLQTVHGLVLPGGGAEHGESPEATLRREILEECGYELEILKPIGFAIEYVFSQDEGYFAKECSFFLTRFDQPVTQPIEHDHELTWRPISEAISKLTFKSQSWAVSSVASIREF